MQLKSSSFDNGEMIPVQFTGEGEDVSPPMEWSKVPSGCQELALICEDPDAPKRAGKDHPFVHWVIYNLSPSTSSLPRGLAQQKSLTVPFVAHQGVNSSGQIGYFGPFPPQGHGVHRYIFTLYALKAETQVKPGATAKELRKAMEGKILETAQWVGTYEREALGIVREESHPPSEARP